MSKSYCLFLLILLMVFLIPINQIESLNESETQTIQVEIKGEVQEPGVYTLDSYSTLDDLLNQCPLNENADLSSLNCTMVLKNGDVIVIPAIPEENKVSINSASKEELMSLYRIGEVLAQRIIDYRNEYGSFQSLEQLMEVKGIGEKTFEKIKDDICL